MQIQKLVLVAALACLFNLLAGGNAQAKAIYYGKVTSVPVPVCINGQNLFTIQADAGGFSAAERTLIAERNINDALVASCDRSPNAVTIDTINGLPVVRLGGFHIVTIDSNTAELLNAPMNTIAIAWADSLRHMLADQTAMGVYVSQLNGTFLTSPFVIPDRRAQLEAARLNHAAFAYRADLPIGLRSSESLANLAMNDLNCDRNVDAAIGHFQDAICMSSCNSRARYGLGLSLLRKGLVVEAIDQLQIARMYDPDYALVHLALGEAFETQGNDVGAVKQYQETALLQPDNPVPYLMIADIREDRNDIGKSVAELQAAQDIIPASQYIRVRRQDQLAWRLRQPM
jgi:Flp pilus assembly protein TadD